VFVSSKAAKGLEALARIIAGLAPEAGNAAAQSLPTLAAQPFTDPLHGTA
jgi:hypothetical protein